MGGFVVDGLRGITAPTSSYPSSALSLHVMPLLGPPCKLPNPIPCRALPCPAPTHVGVRVLVHLDCPGLLIKLHPSILQPNAACVGLAPRGKHDLRQKTGCCILVAIAVLHSSNGAMAHVAFPILLHFCRSNGRQVVWALPQHEMH